MKDLRSLLLGLLGITASVVMVLGAVSLALTEDSLLPDPTVTPTLTPLFYQGTALLPLLPTQSLTPACRPPEHWNKYVVQAGETLQDIAKANGLNAENLMQKNCLESDFLPMGSEIYLPPPRETRTPTAVPFPTNTLQPCGPPPGWVIYIVQPNQTLYLIAQMYNISLYQLMVANCLSDPGFIYVGQRLYVPNIPPQIPPVIIVTPATPAPTLAPSTAVPQNPTLTPSTTPAEVLTPTPVPNSPTEAFPTEVIPSEVAPTQVDFTVPLNTPPPTTAATPLS